MSVKGFLKKKDIVISPKRYGIDALSQMAQAVFASLLIGLIFKTIGEQGQNLMGEYIIFTYFIELGSFAMKQVGASIGIAVAWALKAPPLVMFTSAVTGALGASIGGEAAALVSAIVGLVLTSPLSSTALCIMLNLSGISAGAAAVGCCAQMVGFSATGYRDCKMGGVMAMGLGSSMFQFPNILKNPWILLPPTLSSIIIAPMATCILKTTNTSAGAGMGTCGFVGQIFTFTDMGINARSIISVALLHFVLPICLSLFFDWILRKKGKIKAGDYYFEL